MFCTKSGNRYSLGYLMIFVILPDERLNNLPPGFCGVWCVNLCSVNNLKCSYFVVVCFAFFEAFAVYIAELLGCVICLLAISFVLLIEYKASLYSPLTSSSICDVASCSGVGSK